MRAELAISIPADHVLERGRDSVLSAPVYQAGELVAPSSGTCTVYDRSGGVVSTGDVVLDGEVATYEVAGEDLPDLALDWWAEWELAVGARTVRATNGVIVARQVLRPCLASAELHRAYPSLRSRGLVDDLTPYIQEAHLEIEARLIGQGRRAELVVSPSGLRLPLKHLSMALVYDDLAGSLTEAYASEAARHRELYEAAWAQLALRYDGDLDGLPDEDLDGGRAPYWVA